jgi:hypothetical protein
MTIEQTVDIPVAPIPAVFKPEDTEKLSPETESATPLTDWLSGILSHVGDISPEELRAERLSKYRT